MELVSSAAFYKLKMRALQTLLVSFTVLLPFVEAADELYSEFSEFETQSSVKAGVGYTENVLLGEAMRVDSAFAYFGLEAVAAKPFLGDQYSWNSLVYADVRSFEELEGVPEHSIYLLQTELEGYVGMIAKGRVGARYLNLTQVFDATFDEVDRVDFVVKADEPEFFVGYETIIGEYTYDLELGLGRMTFVDLNSDYDSVNLELEVKRDLTDALRWKSTFSAWERSYRNRFGRDSSGFEISETKLKTEQLAFQTGLRYVADFSGSEHAFGLVGEVKERSDVVSGYYDRSRYTLEFDWRFSLAGVEMDFTTGYGKYEYENQVGRDELMKTSESIYWELELERDLSDSWSVFLNLSGEDDESNESFSTYETQTALLGIRWR